METHKIDHQSGRYTTRIRRLWVCLGVAHYSIGSNWGGGIKLDPRLSCVGIFAPFQCCWLTMLNFKFCFMVKWPFYPSFKFLIFWSNFVFPSSFLTCNQINFPSKFTFFSRKKHIAFPPNITSWSNDHYKSDLQTKFFVKKINTASILLFAKIYVVSKHIFFP